MACLPVLLLQGDKYYFTSKVTVQATHLVMPKVCSASSLLRILRYVAFENAYTTNYCRSWNSIQKGLEVSARDKSESAEIKENAAR